MQAGLDRILTVNLMASTMVFYAVARIYVLPKLGGWSFRTVMPPILLLHTFRHLGLMFLTRGATYPAILASSHTRRHWATSSPPCWLWPYFWPLHGITGPGVSK